jgi:hypothetical protein
LSTSSFLPCWVVNIAVVAFMLLPPPLLPLYRAIIAVAVAALFAAAFAAVVVALPGCHPSPSSIHYHHHRHIPTMIVPQRRQAPFVSASHQFT